MRGFMLHKLRFRHLNMLPPVVALLSFACLLFVVWLLGKKSMEHLELIQTTHVPTMRATLEVDLLTARLSRAFQDAGAAADMGALGEARKIHAELREKLAIIQKAGARSPEDIEKLTHTVDEYYALGERTTRALIAGTLSESAITEISQAKQLYEELKSQLAAAAIGDRAALGRAFEQAGDANRSSMRITMSVALVCLFILGGLSLVVGSTMRALVQEVMAVSAQINSAAAQMSAAANQHEQGASEQVSAVEETRRTMGSLVATGDQVNAAIDVVLRNAEQTQSKNQTIGESIAKLSGTTERIGEVLETIRDIAHKSDLLALNAALEGTKAGEAGRGFSLVATQMQRLAENVMEAVVSIKSLTADIRRASGGSVLATEEGTKLAHETTRSAREIRMVMQQYQAGTEQVSAAMNDISQVGQQSAVSSRQVHTASKDLAALSERLLSVIERFRIDDDRVESRARH
jgi:hypothetical protein